MNTHVTILFLKWHEKMIGEAEQSRIEQHLTECTHCKNYYDKMLAVFEDRSLLSLQPLKADPYLPSRISAIQKSGQEVHPKIIPAIRWSLVFAGAALAIVIGIFIGKGLYNTQTTQSADDLSNYYNIIGQQKSTEQWNYTSLQGEQE